MTLCRFDSLLLMVKEWMAIRIESGTQATSTSELMLKTKAKIYTVEKSVSATKSKK